MFKKIFFSLLVIILAAYLFSTNSIAQSALPGTFSIGYCNEGLCDFTYSGEPGWATSLKGYIYKPSGSGPFPAIVISHGKGGGGAGFCVLGRDWLPNFIAICPNYTHAGGSMGGGGPDGGSPENVKRATRALDILVSSEFANQMNTNVYSSRLYLYGNSMGGFITIETASSVGGRIRAAAYTASGLMDPYTPSGAAQAADIEAPFLMLHGENDGTVNPQASHDFAAALDSYGKTYNLVWFSNGEHNLIYDPSINNQVFQLINDWFSDTSIPTGTPTSTPTPPTGDIPGDANNNQLVDGQDFIIWLTHYGQTVIGPENGNFNNDITVDFADFTIWLNHYTM